MPANPRLSHFVLMTGQLPAMRDWYNRVLGAHVVHENGGLCFLTFDEEHHRLALIAPPFPVTPRTPTTACMHHSAYTFPALDELLARHQALKAEGIEPVTPIQHGITTSLYYRDPDGNLVELQVDNFAHAEEATAYMLGAEFAADPVGPAFDPALMFEALKSGVPASELMTRRWALTGPTLPDPMSRLMNP